MRQVMVRYRVKPGRAAENEELVRAVYEELHRTQFAVQKNVAADEEVLSRT